MNIAISGHCLAASALMRLTRMDIRMPKADHDRRATPQQDLKGQSGRPIKAVRNWIVALQMMRMGTKISAKRD
jgi:hypothetical protein